MTLASQRVSREGIEHQDQEDRKGCRQKRSRPAKQPRPEDKTNE